MHLLFLEGEGVVSNEQILCLNDVRYDSPAVGGIAYYNVVSLVKKLDCSGISACVDFFLIVARNLDYALVYKGISVLGKEACYGLLITVVGEFMTGIGPNLRGIDDSLHINAELLAHSGDLCVCVVNGNYNVVVARIIVAVKNYLSARAESYCLGVKVCLIVPLIAYGVINACKLVDRSYRGESVFLTNNVVEGRIYRVTALVGEGDVNFNVLIGYGSDNLDHYWVGALYNLGLVLAIGRQGDTVGVCTCVSKVQDSEGRALCDNLAVLQPLYGNGLTVDGSVGINENGDGTGLAVVNEGVNSALHIVEALAGLNDNGNGIVKNCRNGNVTVGHLGNGCAVLVYPLYDVSALVLGNTDKSLKIRALWKQTYLVFLAVNKVGYLGYAGNGYVNVEACVNGIKVDKTHDVRYVLLIFLEAAGNVGDDKTSDLIPILGYGRVCAENVVAVVERTDKVAVVELIGNKVIGDINILDSKLLRSLEEVLIFLDLRDDVSRGRILSEIYRRVDLTAASAVVLVGEDNGILEYVISVLAVEESVNLVLKSLENLDYLLEGDILIRLVQLVEVCHVHREELEYLILDAVTYLGRLNRLVKELRDCLGNGNVNLNSAVGVGNVNALGDKVCHSSNKILAGLKRNLKVELGIAKLGINGDIPVEIHLVVSHLGNLIEVRNVLDEILDRLGVNGAVKENVAVNYERLKLNKKILKGKSRRCYLYLLLRVLVLGNDGVNNVGKLVCDFFLLLGVGDVRINYFLDGGVNLLLGYLTHVGKLLLGDNTGGYAQIDHIADVARKILCLACLVNDILEELLIVGFIRAVVLVLNVEVKKSFPDLLILHNGIQR